MKIKSFEDILVWQKSLWLTENIYKELAKCRDSGYKDQLQRASVSIMNNIAEGFERLSNKDFSHFLYIAKGSCGEVRSMITLGERLGYIQKERVVLYYNTSIEISKMLSGLIKSLNTKV